MKRKISIFLVVALLLSIVSVPGGTGMLLAKNNSMPDSDFLDNIYNVYKNDDPSLSKLMNTIEEIEPLILSHAKDNMSQVPYSV